MDRRCRRVSIDVAQYAVRRLEAKGTRGADDRGREDSLEIVTFEIEHEHEHEDEDEEATSRCSRRRCTSPGAESRLTGWRSPTSPNRRSRSRRGSFRLRGPANAESAYRSSSGGNSPPARAGSRR